MKYLPLIFLLSLSGCAGAQEALEDARTAVHDTGTALERMRTVLVALCADPKPEACDELLESFNEVQAAYTAVNEVMP
jgi:hypothetical protein